MKASKTTQQVSRRIVPPIALGGQSAGDSPGDGSHATEVEVCEYIADVSLQLRHLAQSVDHKFLAYLLEMVFEEAFTTTQKRRK
jgi:hypothetical protein